MIEERTFKKLSILVALSILLALSIYILLPILTSIVTGLLLAYIFYPLYRKIFFVVKEKNISSLIVIILAIFIIVLPFWFLLPLMVRQIFDLYLFLQKFDFTSFINNIFPSFSSMNLSRELSSSVNNFISNIINSILTGASGFLISLPNLALKAVVVFFVMFFAMRDAELFKSYVASLSPFSKSTHKNISKKFKDVTFSVIYGFIVVGILQGLLTGLGLLIFGVPGVLLLTVLAILFAIIPILGAWVVWVPVVIYLIMNNHIISGVGLGLYCFIIVSQIDNILRPYIIARKVKISSAIILVGMIGGLISIGILGLILGPLILVYLGLILDAYRKNEFPSLFS